MEVNATDASRFRAALEQLLDLERAAQEEVVTDIEDLCSLNTESLTAQEKSEIQLGFLSTIMSILDS